MQRISSLSLLVAALGSTICPSAAWVLPPAPTPSRSVIRRLPQPASVQEAASTSAEGPRETAVASRRQSVSGLLGTAALALTLSARPNIAKAADEITEKVYMDLDIGGKPAGRVVLGLYGKEAPNTVENFMRLVEGRGQGGATYLLSSVFRVEQGKCIDLGRITGGGGKKLEKKINESGYMRVSSANAAEWTRNDDVNLLRHDKPFLLTTNRGGGTYEFSITLSPNAKLDTDHLVFGRMLEGQEVVESILKVPVSKEDPLGSKQVFASAGKGFDPRAKIIFLNKPLRKIVVKDCGKLV